MTTRGLLDITRAWGPDTCHKPGQYTQRNRSRGQCCPTALLVQDLCGGDIITCKVGRERHYFNRTSQGDIDITWGQYPYGREKRDEAVVSREQLLSRDHVRRRYALLRERSGITTAPAALAP